MMKITPQQLLKIITDEIEDDMGDGYIPQIEDEEDLHDYLVYIKVGGIQIEDFDDLYFQSVALISQIFDDVLKYIDDFCYGCDDGITRWIF